MTEDSYLRWLANETPTSWWHDSALTDEIRRGLDHGAVGATTNPMLGYKALSSDPERYLTAIQEIPDNLSPSQRAEALMSAVARNAAEMFMPEYERTDGKSGYVCAQVDPLMAADRQSMIETAKRFHSWAPNIAVKLPATAAGLDAFEECAAEGITSTITVSFTVPQAIAAAERHRLGTARARKAGIAPGRCYAVIMIGRLDEYLRDVAHDSKADVSESDIRQAGLAVTKRAYSIFKEKGYEATLIVAALRGTYHMEELAGAELIMSIPPTYQTILLEAGMPRDPYRIDVPVPPNVITRLESIPEFVRAYEPHEMKPEEFITYGPTQRLLTQFSVAGWSQLEAFVYDRERL